MTLTRRRFLRQTTPWLAGHTALSLIAPLLAACSGSDGDAPAPPPEPEVVQRFRHGVASGDPLPDRVVLWTRVTPIESDLTQVEVRFVVALDPGLTDVVNEGRLETGPDRDYTVKIDVSGLAPGSTYYYRFSALDQTSPVGRTRTAPAGSVARARLAVASCANYPAGFFNAYRRIAERADLDLVLHLGDYIYEYPNGTLGDGTSMNRLPDPSWEAKTLSDYRTRHAQYKTDPDLQEAHRQHAFVVVWDDHEVANDSFRDGAANHQPESEGDWTERKRSAQRAYFEWMPVRDVEGTPERIYRSFIWGDLFRLLMLDTRLVGRDARIAGNCDAAGIVDPARSLLGPEQEAWLSDEVMAFKEGNQLWCLLGQQVMMGQLSDETEGCVSRPDQWDGYAASRDRLLSTLRDQAIDNVVVLTGDAHASFAADIAERPFDRAAYDPETGAGSLAVELVTPAISSPGDADDAAALLATHPHLKLAETTRQGYLLVDVSPSQVQAEWYYVSTVAERGGSEQFSGALRTLTGQNHLVPAVEAPSPPGEAGRPAP